MSLKITGKDGKEYKLVLGKFDKFFTAVGKNVIFERAGFNWCNQLEVVSSEQYVTVLHSLVENCNLKHEVIRNRTVVGFEIQPLQLDPKLMNCKRL